MERIKLVYTRILDKGQSKGYIVKILKELYSSLGLGGARFLSGRVVKPIGKFKLSDGTFESNKSAGVALLF